MNPILAIEFGGPLMTMFGLVVAAAIGCVGGFIVGSGIGRTQPETPLATSVRLSRDMLASTHGKLERAASTLANEQRSELGARALLVARRIDEISGDLGTIEHKARRDKGASA